MRYETKLKRRESRKTFKLGNLTFTVDETGLLKKAFDDASKKMIKASKQRDKQWKKFLKSDVAKRRF